MHCSRDVPQIPQRFPPLESQTGPKPALASLPPFFFRPRAGNCERIPLDPLSEEAADPARGTHDTLRQNSCSSTLVSFQVRRERSPKGEMEWKAPTQYSFPKLRGQLGRRLLRKCCWLKAASGVADRS